MISAKLAAAIWAMMVPVGIQATLFAQVSGETVGGELSTVLTVSITTGAIVAGFTLVWRLVNSSLAGSRDVIETLREQLDTQDATIDKLRSDLDECRSKCAQFRSDS